MKLIIQKVALSLVFSGVMAVTASATVPTFTIDKSHSTVEFAVQHMALSTVKGVFTDYDGSITWDSEGKTSAIQGKVKVDSVDTRDAKRDHHLKSPDFFDVDHFSEMTLVSKSIKKSGRKYIMTADFTLKGVTKTVKIPLDVSAVVKDPWGNSRIHFAASFIINRKDYGLNFNKVMDNGGLLVGNDVKIALDIEAIQDK